MSERKTWPIVVASSTAVVAAGLGAFAAIGATRPNKEIGQDYSFATISGIDCMAVPTNPQLRYEFTIPGNSTVEEAILNASDAAQQTSQQTLVEDACALADTSSDPSKLEPGDRIDITFTVRRWTEQSSRYAWGIGSVAIVKPQHNDVVQGFTGFGVLGQFTVS